MKETRPCDQCGKPVTRMPSRFLSERTFCGVLCRNRWNLARIDPEKRCRIWEHPNRGKNPPRGEKHPCWKGDAARTTVKRRRAQRAYKVPETCTRCGRKAPVERHHRDGNTGNNSPENIQFLCRRCHMTVDGRMEALAAVRPVPPVKPPEPCINCAKLAKPRRKGRCGACDSYFRAHGTERPALLF